VGLSLGVHRFVAHAKQSGRNGLEQGTCHREQGAASQSRKQRNYLILNNILFVAHEATDGGVMLTGF
jgi:hypothetical protein